MNWGFALTAFGGSLVEFVEAAIIVVAAAAMAGWGVAVKGTLAAAALLAAATAILGVALLHLVPLATLRAVIGALLLLFGVKWLAKATMRLGTYWHPKHAAEERGDARVAFLTAFNGVLLEGAEVVFIVLALGATGKSLGSAVGGAAAAVVLVAFGTAFARGPLAAVPEVVLKYVVGIMLTSFGTFWLGEAIGIPWWGADLSVVGIAVANLLVSWATVLMLRRGRPPLQAKVGERVTA